MTLTTLTLRTCFGRWRNLIRTWLIFKLLVCALFGNQQAYGKCVGPEVTFWPVVDVLPLNPIFMIEAYGSECEFVKSLGSPRNIHLQSGTHLVCLDVQALYYDGKRKIQVLLRADALLKPQRRYYLRIENYQDRKSKNPMLFSESIPRRNLPTWETGTKISQKRPSWVTRPVIAEKIKTSRGCPTYNYVTFAGKASFQGDYLIRAHLRRKGGQRDRTALLVPDAAQMFSVGDMGCEGTFDLSLWPAYQIKFDLIDVAGNMSEWHCKPVLFEPATKDEWLARRR